MTKPTKTDYVAERERLKIVVAVTLEEAMKAAGLRQKDMVERLGITKGRVSMMLNDPKNLTLGSLADFGLACGIRWKLVAIPERKAREVCTHGSLGQGCPLRCKESRR